MSLKSSSTKSPVDLDLSIIIVNWHSADYVLACVRTIRDQTVSLAYEVIVVDNASFDGCGERLAREFHDIIFVQSQCNVGFARANNLGVAHAHGAVLLFLNPDTEIQDRAINRLYECMQTLPYAGAIGCRLLNSDGSLQTSCVQSLPTVLNQVLDADTLRRWFPKSSLWGTAALFDGGRLPKEVEAVSGACMMIRRTTFDTVGEFSREFFMYGEDLDLCYKFRRSGYHNYYLSDGVIVHHGGGSSQQRRSDFSIVMMRESVSRFLSKSRGRFYSYCYRWALSASALIRIGMLGVLSPVWLARFRPGSWDASFRKWIVILRWGLGLEQWTRQYEQFEKPEGYLKGDVRNSCAASAEN